MTDKSTESTLTNSQLRNLALTAGQEVTYTAVPVGAGTRMSTDRDEDTVLDADDNCPTFVNPGQEDSDSDETGNSCDADDDNDGVPDTHDTFPLDSNLSGDLDGDGIDNIIDTDDDGDGLLDAVETNTYGTDPFNADTDLDGSSDGAEITAGTDPLDPASTPPIADGDVNGDGQVNVADLNKSDKDNYRLRFSRAIGVAALGYCAAD